MYIHSCHEVKKQIQSNFSNYINTIFIFLNYFLYVAKLFLNPIKLRKFLFVQNLKKFYNLFFKYFLNIFLKVMFYDLCRTIFFKPLKKPCFGYFKPQIFVYFLFISSLYRDLYLFTLVHILLYYNMF